MFDLDILLDTIELELESILRVNLKTTTLELNNNTHILLDAMCYSVVPGGKRIRPLFTIVAGEMSNATLDTLTKIGCAIELIHCYSLIHDDLPSMDNDDLRRGRLSAAMTGISLLSIGFGGKLAGLLADGSEITDSVSSVLQVMHKYMYSFFIYFLISVLTFMFAMFLIKYIKGLIGSSISGGDNK
jgi:hypothetical protein